MPHVSSIAQVNVLALIEGVKHDGKPNNTHSHAHAHENTTASTPVPSPKSKTKRRATTRDNENLLKQALAYSRAGAPRRTSMVVGMEEDEGGEIRATAAALLRHLIVDKQECLRTHFRKIPFMPQASIRDVLGRSRVPRLSRPVFRLFLVIFFCECFYYIFNQSPINRRAKSIA